MLYIIYIYFTCYGYTDVIKKYSLKDSKRSYDKRFDNFYETRKEF